VHCVANFWIVGSEMLSVQSAAGVNVPCIVWRLFRVLVTSWVLRERFVMICRYESNSGGEREIQRTMLELLNQLDGFDSKGDVKVS